MKKLLKIIMFMWESHKRVGKRAVRSKVLPSADPECAVKTALVKA